MEEGDGFAVDLISQSPHTHDEVTITCGDDRVSGHVNVGLVVLSDDHCRGGNDEDLLENARKPQRKLDGLYRRKMFHLNRTQTCH